MVDPYLHVPSAMCREGTTVQWHLLSVSREIDQYVLQEGHTCRKCVCPESNLFILDVICIASIAVIYIIKIRREGEGGWKGG